MADRKYVIEYVVEPAAAIRGLDAIEKKLAAVDAAVDRLTAKLAGLPKALQPAGMTVGANQMATALDQIRNRAEATRNAVSGVGANTSNMNGAANRAATLAANLDKVTASGLAAGRAVGGVGGGGVGRGGAGGGGNGGGGGIFAGFGRAAMRRTVFAGLHMGAEALRDGAEARKQYMEQATDRFNDFRKELQEVANLSGAPTVNDKVVDDQLKFQRDTAMSADEAINFREQFLGAVESGRARGNITDEVASGLGIQAAQFAQRYNVDAASAGKLAGLLGEYGKVPTAEAGASKMAEVAYHLNKIGVGQVRSMIPSLIGLQGEMVDENGGRFASLEALSARFAASTIRSKSPATAATQIRQANTALRRFGSEEVEGSTGHTLAALGINADMDYESAIKAIAPKITGPDGDLWLIQHGFANQAERRSLIAQARLNPVVEAQLGKTDAKSALELKQVREGAAAANAGYLKTDIGRQKLAENETFATQVGFGRKQTRFERARTEAESRRRQRGEIDTPMYAAAEALLSATNLGMMSGRDYSLDTEVYADIIKRNKVSKEEIAAKFPRFGELYGSPFDPRGRISTNPQERAQLYEQVSAAFDKAGGGNRGGQPAAKINQAGDLLKQAAQQMAAQPNVVAPGPPPGFVAGRP